MIQDVCDFAAAVDRKNFTLAADIYAAGLNNPKKTLKGEQRLRWRGGGGEGRSTHCLDTSAASAAARLSVNLLPRSPHTIALHACVCLSMRWLPPIISGSCLVAGCLPSMQAGLSLTTAAHPTLTCTPRTSTTPFGSTTGLRCAVAGSGPREPRVHCWLDGKPGGPQASTQPCCRPRSKVVAHWVPPLACRLA